MQRARESVFSKQNYLAVTSVIVKKKDEIKIFWCLIPNAPLKTQP